MSKYAADLAIYVPNQTPFFDIFSDSCDGKNVFMWKFCMGLPIFFWLSLKMNILALILYHVISTVVIPGSLNGT